MLTLVYQGLSYGRTDIILMKSNRLSLGLLLVIFTSSINILVLYLLVLLAIYLQIDIYPRFIYKLILVLDSKH